MTSKDKAEILSLKRMIIKTEKLLRMFKEALKECLNDYYGETVRMV